MNCDIMVILYQHKALLSGNIKQYKQYVASIRMIWKTIDSIAFSHWFPLDAESVGVFPLAPVSTVVYSIVIVHLFWCY